MAPKMTSTTKSTQAKAAKAAPAKSAKAAGEALEELDQAQLAVAAQAPLEPQPQPQPHAEGAKKRAAKAKGVADGEADGAAKPKAKRAKAEGECAADGATAAPKKRIPKDESPEDMKKRLVRERKKKNLAEKEAVFNGDLAKTANSLTKDSLVKVRVPGKNGKPDTFEIMSRYKFLNSASGIAPWRHSVEMARKELGITGFAVVKNPENIGSNPTAEEKLAGKLYTRAKEINAELAATPGAIEKIVAAAKAKLEERIVKN